MTPERIARAFHEAYERLAPDYGYKTQEASAKPWEEVPEDNRNLMIAVVAELLEGQVIHAPQTEEPLNEPKSFSRQNMGERITEVSNEMTEEARKRSGREEI